MDMTGERRISAPPEAVWAALNDPEILRAAIPGCEDLVKESDTAMQASAVVKVGPINAKFTGKVLLHDLDPPNGYRITGEGQGGVAGFAKGGATVTLHADGAGTLLKYDVKAQVGGKMAQLGARLIDASARQMADAFFTRFAELVATPMSEATAIRPAAISLFAMIPRAPLGYPLIGWVGVVLCLAILILLFGSAL
jgi:carbon monoxide dehydrogenase subunit G